MESVFRTHDVKLTEPSYALQQVTYSSSVDIRPEWPVVESIPFTSLAKLNFTVGQPEDIAFCGALEYYDKVYDRVTPKADRPLKRTNKVFKSVTTSDDPVIRYGTLLCQWARLFPLPLGCLQVSATHLKCPLRHLSSPEAPSSVYSVRLKGCSVDT